MKTLTLLYMFSFLLIGTTSYAHAVCAVGVQYGRSEKEFYDINRLPSGLVKVMKRLNNDQTWKHPYTDWKQTNFKVSIDRSHIDFYAPQEDGKEIQAQVDILKLHPTNNPEIMVGAGTLIIGSKVQETIIYVNKGCL